MLTAAPPPATARRWWTLPVVGLAQLMVVLDATIVNIALPSAQHELGMADADRHWVVTAYALAFGGLLLLGGRVCAALGHRRAFTLGLIGFALASGLGGAAGNAGTLIAARAAQGVFAALLAPAALSLLTLTFTTARERGRAFGVFAGVGAGGAALGVVAGGLLTQYADWRWCLYINVPMAALALLGTPLIARDRPAGSLRNLDVPGVVLSATGFVALVYGFTRAEARGWTDPPVLALLAGGVALLAAFAVVQRKTRHPLLPPRIPAHRARATALVSVALMFLAMFGFYLFVSYYTQTILGYTAVQAGLTLLVNAVAAIAGSTLLARIRLAPATLITGSLLLAAAGTLVLTRLGADGTGAFATRLLPAQVLTGLGLGCLLAAATNLVTADVAGPEDAGIASAAYNAVQQLGAALGTALLNSIALGVTAARLDDGAAPTAATVDGYAVAMWAATGVLTAAALAVTALSRNTRS
ncbi:MFS transporter [Phytomonospora endophytica]|uniref:EmrB/QacA subfamily drug resistance transporter n=1 Tax=Phytomonospora endophytica TaxID=714109 RepID=A0A841FQP3_9ACTN|nr:MFS transporter [Phytomonospora endophytica]MBB6034280.1 EmrB/QacA subfamily drug resistance transporter [Phytomonospora endophytica]GIG66673.1 MFS transporter [Phytomonospora endophytica]